MTAEQYYYQYFEQDFNTALGQYQGQNLADRIFLLGQDLFDGGRLQNVVAQKDHFLCCLAFSIILQKTLKQNFSYDYLRMKNLGVDWRLSQDLSDSEIDPWELLGQAQDEQLVSEFSRFFAQDCREFFISHRFFEATWESMRFALISDFRAHNSQAGISFLENIRHC